MMVVFIAFVIFMRQTYLTITITSMQKKIISLLLFTFIISAIHAAIFYVATDGNDANPGNKNKPFATIQKAQDAVRPGDTVYVRGGTYQMHEQQIARKERLWAYVTYLDK